MVVAEGTGDVTTALYAVLSSMSDSSKKGAVTPRTLFNSLRARLVVLCCYGCGKLGYSHTHLGSLSNTVVAQFTDHFRNFELLVYLYQPISL